MSDAIDATHAIDATRDSIAQASAIQLLRDRFAAYPEVRSFLAAYDEPHRTVADKVAALLTPTRHHVISRAQHARVKGGKGCTALAALGYEEDASAARCEEVHREQEAEEGDAALSKLAGELAASRVAELTAVIAALRAAAADGQREAKSRSGARRGGQRSPR